MSKNDEFGIENKKLCSKTRNCVLKMINFAAGEPARTLCERWVNFVQMDSSMENDDSSIEMMILPFQMMIYDAAGRAAGRRSGGVVGRYTIRQRWSGMQR